MKRTSTYLATIILTLGSSVVAAQSIPVSPIALTNNVTLKAFVPVDSLFVNPTQSDFTVTLNNTISGAATEYRVSRFADFRDANWRPYNAHPTLAIPGSWFESTATPGASQVLLHFQVRNKNPLAGRPISFIDGKTQVQPDFFFSDVLTRRVRIIFVG